MSAAKKRGDAPAGRKTVAVNKKALFKYQVVEKFEAGLSLVGTEVKSLRDRSVNFTDSYARFAGNGSELYLFNLNIAVYEPASRMNHDPTRPRKLLMHRRELERLAGKLRQKGMTLVPTAIYFSGPWAKAELALVTAKTAGDKRRTIIEREAKRDLDRARKWAGR
jgi:SsrA-binding protein